MNAAAFHTIKSNARTPGINPGDPPTVLQGEHVVTGVEVGANGSVTSRWQLFGSYTFMRSEITRSNTAAEIGREFANTPDHSLSLWTMFRLPWDVEVGGGTQYVGDRFNSNTGARTAPGYWLVDAMAAYRVSERLTLRLNGFNLADERYIDRVGGGHFIPGAARSAMLTLDVGLLSLDAPAHSRRPDGRRGRPGPARASKRRLGGWPRDGRSSIGARESTISRFPRVILSPKKSAT